ncbi:serine hydrolase domain-containing protein [Psychrobacillus psychrodurans]|uniref:serine hydrolase domain-containing protein n=1 Tax=Psychrobacillus psychrodurans TaxID=126157 RepID=UPI0008E4DDDC|nr:serine hydrolase [Psychrobacillus psychrodurans]MCZ8539656.1 beta-lactamase family protein [Psychrobacillus psychrodurans]SFM43876.1 CubicO group peptidase, beta-lactamase class C family [Psychrobacillus psychrodurans]
MNNNPISNFEDLIKKEYSNISGVVIIKDESLIYEKYFDGYTKDDVLHIASVTKSIISVLIGIAIDKGYIKNVEQKVLEFFPDYTVKRGEKTIQNITIKNLMTMTAPYKYKSEPYTKIYTSDDWIKATLDLLGGKGDIGEFKYSTVGTHILSGVLVSATGQSVIDFATESLFKPLKIKAPKNVIIQNKEEYLAFLKDKYVTGWIVDPKGINTAGWGLTLTARDMAKIGQLYLSGGVWNGNRILSSKWIEDSTKEKTRWGELSYGYLWWIVDDCYAALGDGGNVIFINPKKEMVVTIASRFLPRAKDRIELIRKHIMPLFE